MIRPVFATESRVDAYPLLFGLECGVVAAEEAGVRAIAYRAIWDSQSAAYSTASCTTSR